jgi:uncharacterized membrane protein YfcA
MEFLLGFAIAVLIGLTGVGGGVITAPVLTLFLGIPPVESVGTALVFTAIVKLAAAPVYLLRRQVSFRILGLLLLGGLPGVVGGSYVLAKLSRADHRHNATIFALLGATVIVMAGFNLYRLFRPERAETQRERLGWLPWIAIPIGAEVGFSSAGAGALGSLVLMSFTLIPAGQIVGTDVLFGLGLSLAGGGISLGTGNYAAALAMKMAAGGLLGAFVGANLLSFLPARPVRVALCLWLVSVGGQLCWRAVTA